MRTFLPYGRQCIDEDDIQAVANVLKSDFLTTGPAVEQFEAALAEKLEVKHAIVCSNGTTALHLAYLAYGVGEGDAVIVPSITFVATANAARMCGAEVVFADVDPDNGLMTAATLQHAFDRAGEEVKLAVPVHLTGQSEDLSAMKALCDEYGAKIVTDSCHALGGEYAFSNQKGMLGDCRFEEMACFSFHPVKNIAMGEGGAVTTNDDKLAAQLRLLRSHGMVREADRFQNTSMGFDADGQMNPWYHEFPELGYNYRASDIQCALGRNQLLKLDRFLDKRRQLAAAYDNLLKDLAPFIRPIKRTSGCRSALHLYPVLIDFDQLGKSRKAVMEDLKSRGVGSQVHYIPVHRQPYYEKLYGLQKLPGADAYYERTLSLPLYPDLTIADVEHVVDCLKSLLP